MSDTTIGASGEAPTRRRPSWPFLIFAAVTALGGGITLDRYVLSSGSSGAVSGCADAQRVLSDNLQESNSSTEKGRMATAAAIAVVEQHPACFATEDRANIQAIKASEEDRRARCSSATTWADRKQFC